MQIENNDEKQREKIYFLMWSKRKEVHTRSTYQDHLWGAGISLALKKN